MSATTAKELRELLADVPDDVLVIMSKDAEGNNFSPLSGYTTGLHYEAETTWYGEVRDPDEKEEDGTFYHDEETREHIKSLPEAFVLWPVN